MGDAANQVERGRNLESSEVLLELSGVYRKGWNLGTVLVHNMAITPQEGEYLIIVTYMQVIAIEYDIVLVTLTHHMNGLIFDCSKEYLLHGSL